MVYKILIQKRAEKFIESQTLVQRVRILKAIKMLPNFGDVKPIVGQDLYFRLRLGDVRIIFKAEYDIITVIDAANIK